MEPTDYVGWANGLKQAGYATNPKYAPTLIKLIEDYNLQEYTLLVLGNEHLNTTAEIMPISDSNLTDKKKLTQTRALWYNYIHLFTLQAYSR
jgi:GR25 family glycosyltransferase involved in LPS biosynthesis